MKSCAILCAYCRQPFVPSIFHPHQRVCLSPDCQRRRRNDYHRRKQRTDPQYRQVCKDSRDKWRANNPDYQRQYRKDHPGYVQQNVEAQKHRDQKRRLGRLAKNKAAVDLKRLAAEIWLVGPDLDNLVKNNLAISQVVIYQSVAGGRP
jgi:hypothetical protein